MHAVVYFDHIHPLICTYTDSERSYESDDDASAQPRSRRVTFSPIPDSDTYSYSEEDSLYDRAQVEAELTAVEAFEIFPDADIWANAYDLFRFSERPGDRAVDVSASFVPPAVRRPEVDYAAVDW